MHDLSRPARAEYRSDAARALPKMFRMPQRFAFPRRMPDLSQYASHSGAAWRRKPKPAVQSLPCGQVTGVISHVDQTVERVTQIGNDVSSLLDPHRETNHAIADTALGALFRRQFAVRRDGWRARQGIDIPQGRGG